MNVSAHWSPPLGTYLARFGTTPPLPPNTVTRKTRKRTRCARVHVPVHPVPRKTNTRMCACVHRSPPPRHDPWALCLWDPIAPDAPIRPHPTSFPPIFSSLYPGPHPRSSKTTPLHKTGKQMCTRM